MNEEQFWEAAGSYLTGPAPLDQWLEIAGRASHRFRLYKERNKDANPYYPDSRPSGLVATALDAIIAKAGPHDCNDRAEQVLARLCAIEGQGKPDRAGMADALMQSPEALVRDFAYFVSHHVVRIDRVAGGHRSRLINDTEIDITISPLEGYSKDDVEALLAEVCEETGISFDCLD